MPPINVNGQTHDLNDVPDDTPLLCVLRDHLGLSGTKYGCGMAQCGACTVHVDGVPVQACVTELGEVVGTKVVTIEGLSKDGSHPVQKAWKEHNVPLCDYCQSGQIMMATAILESTNNPTDEYIESEMWNICRCGSYPNVRAAIKSAAKEMFKK
ncbi:(2Fe-2S)-binding protein [Planctomycetota bacterium]